MDKENGRKERRNEDMKEVISIEFQKASSISI
jgi:hypothetical protein